MKTLKNLLIVATLLMAIGNAFAVSITDAGKNLEKANTTLQNSVMALDRIMDDAENSIPPSLISQSEGIVIFPNAFKLAFGVAGGQGGRGIAMIHNDDGSWSNPFFINLGEGSLGLQIGAKASDIVLLFKDKSDILEIEGTEIELGSDIVVTTGPVSKSFSSTTDIKFQSEIYSYGRSKGLFAGISVKGGVLTYNKGLNEAVYGYTELNAKEILQGIDTPYNDKVNDLIMALVMYGD
jgi:lipid-binding SYLF domain-containing protein